MRRSSRCRTSLTGARSGGRAHLLQLVPGQKPRLVRHAPEDYWYEQGGVEPDPFWLGSFRFEEAGSVEAAWKTLGRPTNAAYVGNETERAAAAGLAVNPGLASRLDWVRSYKDEYEVRCLEEATALGASGHEAAREAFRAGASELEIHQAFVRAVGCTDAQLPYTTIVALDEKGATLHYESKRSMRDGRVLLLDAGAQARRYACDITRTTPAPGCDARFAELVLRLDALEPELAGAALPGRPYLEVHLQAHAGVARILSDLRLVRLPAEEVLAKGCTHPFFPHGIGHHLGIQVHDVAGRQADPSGTPAPPPKEHPVPPQHTDDRARPRLHDRARDLLHPDAAAALPVRARRLRLRLGSDRRPHPARAACGSRTTWSSPLRARATSRASTSRTEGRQAPARGLQLGDELVRRPVVAAEERGGASPRVSRTAVRRLWVKERLSST